MKLVKTKGANDRHPSQARSFTPQLSLANVSQPNGETCFILNPATSPAIRYRRISGAATC
ncbi:hypothetical protein [Alkalinema sp. FACHB-956]|uniref:hypothetical protein n=1 Tax=Alkalinema sp. FACHB-956 TaxID=2692768 RepID=UPI001681DF93|nr:hypothetical protein [Alkalinema sp. FACHB-956]MBD2325288.1 hypothetical protein [Alkalinema sp. FACHB-956]